MDHSSHIIWKTDHTFHLNMYHESTSMKTHMIKLPIINSFSFLHAQALISPHWKYLNFPSCPYIITDDLIYIYNQIYLLMDDLIFY